MGKSPKHDDSLRVFSSETVWGWEGAFGEDPLLAGCAALVHLFQQLYDEVRRCLLVLQMGK